VIFHPLELLVAVISITGCTGSRAPVASRRSGIDACGNCTLNISERVVQQHFVVTDVNAGGRHAGVSTVKGRSQWMSRVGAP
jgi:hypothetical protein